MKAELMVDLNAVVGFNGIIPWETVDGGSGLSFSHAFTINTSGTGQVTLTNATYNGIATFRIKGNKFKTNRSTDDTSLQWYVQLPDGTNTATYTGYALSDAITLVPGQTFFIRQATNASITYSYDAFQKTFIVYEQPPTPSLGLLRMKDSAYSAGSDFRYSATQDVNLFTVDTTGVSPNITYTGTDTKSVIIKGGRFTNSRLGDDVNLQWYVSHPGGNTGVVTGGNRTGLPFTLTNGQSFQIKQFTNQTIQHYEVDFSFFMIDFSGILVTEVLTNTAGGTWTPLYPADNDSYTIYMVGGGGGGGGGTTGTSNQGRGGGGGGGGGESRNITTIISQASFPVTYVAGAKGLGGERGVNGTAGTSTTFSTFTAVGGGAGLAAVGGGSGGAGGTGGTGGTAYAGGAGGNGAARSGTLGGGGGGGGGAGGTTGVGSPGTAGVSGGSGGNGGNGGTANGGAGGTSLLFGGDGTAFTKDGLFYGAGGGAKGGDENLSADGGGTYGAGGGGGGGGRAGFGGLGGFGSTGTDGVIVIQYAFTVPESSSSAPFHSMFMSLLAY